LPAGGTTGATQLSVTKMLTVSAGNSASRGAFVIIGR